MLIKELIFRDLDIAMSTLSQMALAPCENHEVRPEYENYIEEFRVRDGVYTFSLIALWGEGDVFFIHDKDPKAIEIIDHVHLNDPDHAPKVHLQLLQLLKRCAMVGYVPVNLLSAIRLKGREGVYQQFLDEYNELIDYVNDVVEGLEEAW